SVFLTQKGELLARYATKKVLELYSELSDEAHRIANTLIEIENKLTGLRVYTSTKAIIILAQELIGNYLEYKKVNAKMDYDDLIVVTRNLLEDKTVADWVLYKLDGGIDNVLIDEAQDTSPNQWAIVRSLTQEFFDAENKTIFVVGDRKQSIYSFQGADPQEFEKMRRYFREKAHNFDEVNLEVSFRSTAAVLDSVNTVFINDVAKTGVVPEGQNVIHIPFRVGDGGKVEIWPLLEAEKDENPDVWMPPVERKTSNTTSSRLAKLIAQKIKYMVENENLVSKNRKLQYRDFMILVQRRNAFVEELVRECKQIGVSIAGVDKIKLSEQIAVQDLIALGNFLLLPTDDLTLAEVLKSPLFGFDDDDLFELCYNRKNASLWTRLGDNSKYKETYQILQNLLNMADYVRPFELYSYVLNTLQGRKKFEIRMGAEVDDGLDEFINMTIDFEREHIPTLQSFISWIGKDEVEIKRELEQSEIDAVRIMTVHGSKGLQAPIVILPDMVRQVNSKKGMGMLWDDIFYYPLSSADYEKNCEAIKEREKQSENEEYRRLLYVALTRAEDRLCLCGYYQKNKPKDDCWYELCASSLKPLCVQQGDNLIYEVAQRYDVIAKD
ncbi:MAG: UvrD-helicase domain-containing protein, partial [Alphaproteobacteria bacterium]|nr:UvrD-helicase domain-containing protein [Alphaproteobacteria bacterium]